MVRVESDVRRSEGKVREGTRNLGVEWCSLKTFKAFEP